MALRTRNAVLLFKIESTPGTENVPSASTDAVLIEVTGNPITFNPNNITPNEATGSLDNKAPIVGGMTAQIDFSVFLKGSGVAGTAPEFGDLLRACGWTETLVAATVPAGAAEALAAGGSTTTAVLGASAVGTAQLYRGMPLTLSGAVPSSGLANGLTFISDYTAGKTATLVETLGGALVATTNYLVEKNVRYQPGSSSIPSGTLYLYMDGLLYKFVGTRGNSAISLASGQAGKINFRMMGQFLTKTDAAVPTATFDSARPPIWRAAAAASPVAAALVNRLAAAIATLSLDSGNQVIFPDNPNAQEGYDPAEIVSRNMTGSMDPLETLVATRDIMTDFRAGTQRILHARYGGTAGNRVALTIPAAQYTNQSPGDRSGLLTVGVPFAATGPDAGAALTFF